MTERPYQKLLVWQQAHQFCLFIYRLTNTFPREERYRLIDQMVRSARSVPTNIAEGNGRRSAGDKRNFFQISLASLEEVHYHGLLARDLGYINNDVFLELDEKVRSIGYLLTKLRNAY